MRPSSSSSATSAALLAVAGLLCSAGPIPARDLPPFRVVTLDGEAYASQAEPVIKKGYLFLIDERGGFFSLPLEAVDWRATREANRSVPPGLLDRWDEGPVRYLLDHEQRREFRALRGDLERSAWISSFWAALDPTPDSFLNEKRREYWRRVASANFLFADSTRPGWMTDRGKIYILLGPPHDTQSYPSRVGNDARFDARVMASDDPDYPRHTVPPRGVVRWLYRNLPGGNADPDTIVAFREDATGEYHLSSEAMDYDRVFADSAANLLPRSMNPRLSTRQQGESAAQKPENVANAGRAGVSPLSLLGLLSDLGEIQKEALTGDWLAEVVTAREYFAVFPLRSAFHFYRTQEGTTYVEVNLSVEAASQRRREEQPAAAGQESPYRLSARLVADENPARRVEFTAEDGFVAIPDPAGAPGRWLYQSGAGMPPGSYTLLVAVTDTRSAEVGSWRETVQVPDLSSPGLLLGDLVLASRVEAAAEPAGEGAKQPFIHGRLRVIPNLDRVYTRGSELAFYYQIYGAAADPQTGRPDLDLEYRIERLEAGQAQALGAPVRLEAQRESSHAFSLPLVGWPEGSYRLSVQVTDRLAGTSAARQAEFRVLGE